MEANDVGVVMSLCAFVRVSVAIFVQYKQNPIQLDLVIATVLLVTPWTLTLKASSSY